MKHLCAIVETGPQQFYVAFPGEVDPRFGGKYAERPYFLLRGGEFSQRLLMDEVQGVLENMIGAAPQTLTLDEVMETMAKRYEIDNGFR